MISKILKQTEGIDHGFGTRADASPFNGHLLQQVHGKKIIVHRKGELDNGEVEFEADAWITNDPGFVVGIKTADCVPILLYDPTQKVVAAVHAGWKGTSLNISEEAVKKLKEDFYSKPSDLVAAIGPAMGFYCYEVGEDVWGPFKKKHGENAFVLARIGREKYLLDTQKANEAQLLEAGLLPEKIETLVYCTHCRSDLFHSVRRDGDEAGRQVSWIKIR